jgi:hypothetical protein
MDRPKLLVRRIPSSQSDNLSPVIDYRFFCIRGTNLDRLGADFQAMADWLSGAAKALGVQGRRCNQCLVLSLSKDGAGHP